MQSREDTAINLFGYTFMLLFSAFCLLPFALVIAGSFTDEAYLLSHGTTLFPGETSLLAYKLIFMDTFVFDAYKVTIFTTVVGTMLDLIITSAMAYAISVSSMAHRNKIAFFAYFTMLFSGGLVPSYLLIAKYLHLKDSIWVYILPVLINPYNMFLLRNFFKTIPDSLAESAKIDGANDIFILFRIVLPLSKPALATIGLFYALGHWNEWFTCLLYIDNKKLISLQYLIMKILRELDYMKNLANEQQSQAMVVNYTAPLNSAKMATAVVTVGPIIFLYPFVQKYFVKGLVVGAVKG
jgi:multiple sugar transport system permease protein/putative aldouronate transport system permease protein